MESWIPQCSICYPLNLNSECLSWKNFLYCVRSLFWMLRWWRLFIVRFFSWQFFVPSSLKLLFVLLLWHFGLFFFIQSKDTHILRCFFFSLSLSVNEKDGYDDSLLSIYLFCCHVKLATHLELWKQCHSEEFVEILWDEKPRYNSLWSIKTVISLIYMDKSAGMCSIVGVSTCPAGLIRVHPLFPH